MGWRLFTEPTTVGSLVIVAQRAVQASPQSWYSWSVKKKASPHAPHGLRPGDAIEWVCHNRRVPVLTGEEMFSSRENAWTKIGGELFHVVVAVGDESLTWVNKRGVFTAKYDDFFLRNSRREGITVDVRRLRWCSGHDDGR